MDNNNNVIERLTTFANWCVKAQLVKSRTDFERECNLSRGYILNSQLLGTTSVGSDTLANVHARFPFLSLTWLITGNGNMTATQENEKDYAYQELKNGFQKYQKIKKIVEEGTSKLPQKGKLET